MILFFCAFVIVVIWPKVVESKKHNVRKDPITGSQSPNPSVQEKLVNVPPVKDNLSAEQLRELEQAKDKSNLEGMKELIRTDYNTPIDFWGKVVDQDGNPLAGVKIDIVIDQLAGRKSHVVFSDEKGLFELLGKRGARTRVSVSKDGYAATSNKEIGSRISSRTIYYSMEAMPAYAPPTRENPQVFALRKKNPVANLAHATKKRVSIDETGDTQKIELELAGRTVGIEVRCWSSSPVPFTYERYNWRAEIQITNGRLLPYNSMNSFQSPQIEAPVDGYQKVFKVVMPKDSEKIWKATSITQRDFWIQFDDGTYAKARIEVKTGRKHEVDVEVWYNLDGTNNFEQ